MYKNILTKSSLATPFLLQVTHLALRSLNLPTDAGPPPPGRFEFGRMRRGGEISNSHLVHSLTLVLSKLWKSQSCRRKTGSVGQQGVPFHLAKADAFPSRRNICERDRSSREACVVLKISIMCRAEGVFTFIFSKISEPFWSVCRD